MPPAIRLASSCPHPPAARPPRGSRTGSTSLPCRTPPPLRTALALDLAAERLKQIHRQHLIDHNATLTEQRAAQRRSRAAQEPPRAGLFLLLRRSSGKVSNFHVRFVFHQRLDDACCPCLAFAVAHCNSIVLQSAIPFIFLPIIAAFALQLRPDGGSLELLGSLSSILFLSFCIRNFSLCIGNVIFCILIFRYFWLD